MRYIRQGECGRCGQCCEEENCEHFEPGEIATCKIYNSKRPSKCEWVPQLPPIVFSKCTYTFIDTWEDNKIIKAKEI